MDAQTETQDTEVEKYEWRNVLGNVEHKRCLTDDGRVLEVYRQTDFPESSPFAFVWNLFSTPGPNQPEKWGNAASLMEAMQRAEAYAWASEEADERAE